MTDTGWDDLDNDPAAEARAKGQADTGNGKRSMATELVELAKQNYTLHVDDAGATFALKRGGPNVALPLRGGRLGLRAALASSYHAEHGRAATSAALTDAVTVIEGLAAAKDPTPTVLRCGRDTDDRIVIDLGQPDGAVVVVDAGGWQIMDDSPVVLSRSRLTDPLPYPVGGGDLGELRDLLNVTETTWPLLVGWSVATLVPDIPHPVLAVTGEQGTGKSTAAKMVVQLVDPSPAPLRTSPRDVEAWAVAAAGSWVVALDNVSGLTPWLSDALCRAATGDGMVRRKLYTDDEVSVLAYRRAVILTSIDAGALRGDLADRLVRVELGRIDPARRRTDADLAARYEAARPRLLGALLDLLAAALAELPHVQLDTLPRMADFARVVAAVDAVTGMDGLRRYLALGAELAEDVIDADPVADAVRNFTRDQKVWTGTTKDLLKEISPDPVPKGWPRNAHALSGALRRDAPALRAVGVTVTYHRRNANGRTHTLEWVGRDGGDDHDDLGQGSSVVAENTSPNGQKATTPSDLSRKRTSRTSTTSSGAAEQAKHRDDPRDDPHDIPGVDRERHGERHDKTPGSDGNDDDDVPERSLSDADGARVPSLFENEQEIHL